MEPIDFYVLPSATDEAWLTFVCKLTEKIYRLGKRCFIWVDDFDIAEQLDEHLWAFRADSFVPHGIEENELPVCIGGDLPPADTVEVLINLSATPSEAPFTRQVEILDQQPERLSAAREKYRFYQQAKRPLKTHKLS